MVISRKEAITEPSLLVKKPEERREREPQVASTDKPAESSEAPAEAASSALDAANRAVLARLDELRARPELLPSITPEEREAFLVHLDSRRLLVDRQIAIEGWLADWRRAVAAAA